MKTARKIILADVGREVKQAERETNQPPAQREGR